MIHKLKLDVVLKTCALLFFGVIHQISRSHGRKIDDLNPISIRLLGRSQLSNPSDFPCFRLAEHYFSVSQLLENVSTTKLLSCMIFKLKWIPFLLQVSRREELNSKLKQEAMTQHDRLSHYEEKVRHWLTLLWLHMNFMVLQITARKTVCSTASGLQQIKLQCSALLVLWGNHGCLPFCNNFFKCIFLNKNVVF